MKKCVRSALIVLGLALTATMGQAAGTFSTSTTQPTFDGVDIGWFHATSPSPNPGDKWFAEISGAGQTKGQTFTTTSDVQFKAVSYRIANSQAAPTKVYIVRIGAIDPVANKFYELHSEEITQTINWGVGETDSYGTWTLDTPLTLPSGAYIGVDIAMKSSSSAWQTGIPYPQYNNSSIYAGGAKYTRPQTGTTGSASDVMQMDASRDREFHLDLEATTITDTTAPNLLSVEDNMAGGPIYEDRVEVQYTLTFDEYIDETTIDLADFVNVGSGVSLTGIRAVTQTTPFPAASVITLIVGVSGTGTLQLGIASGSDITDHYGNPITSPVSDDTTITVNAGSTPSLGTLSWDGPTPASTIGDGVSSGGSGDWNTTDVIWDRGFGLTPLAAWNNANGDSAYFAGSGSTITLGEDIVVSNLTINTANNYIIGDATEDNTLSFVDGATITVGETTGAGDTTMRLAINGSPAVTFRGRANNAAFLSLLPPSGATMTLGTVSVLNTYGSNKNLYLSGEGTNNVVDKVTWTVTNNQLALRKQAPTTSGPDATRWTINQNISIDDGRIYVDEGTLLLKGTDNFISHSIEIAAGGRISLQGNWRIHDENEDFRVLSGGIVAPGDGVGTATFNWNSSRGDPSVGLVDLRTGATYEWEVGPSATDVIALTEPVAGGNAELVVASGTTLKILDAGGTPKPDELLPVFTYAAGVVTPNTATLNANMTIDMSALDGWSGTPSLTNDVVTLTIYVTGLQGPITGTLIQLF